MNSVQVSLVFLVLSFTSILAIGRTPLIQFYTTNNCIRAIAPNPPFHNYTSSKNVTFDMSTGNGFLSYCVVRGAWRVELSYLQHEADFNISIGDGCINCNRARLNARYGVIRLLAGNDLTQPVLSMYSGRNFAGHETQIKGGEYTFNNTYSFMSFAFTSYSNWTWQTYYSPHFRGNSTCHRPNPASEVTLVNHTALNVGSIRLGCRNNGLPLRFTGVGVIIGVILALVIPSVSVIL